MMKRGIWIILILSMLISSSIAYADYLNIELSGNKTSINQAFDGVLKFNFSGSIEVDKNLNFNVNNLVYSKKLKDIYLHLGKTRFLAPEVNKNGNEIQDIPIIFSSPGSKTVVGIDLSSTGGNIAEVSKLSIGFVGEAISNSYPTLKLDIGNDGITDYTFQGTPLDSYTLMDNSYLGDNMPDQWKGIRGNNRDTYCQTISLVPSNEYKINIKARKLVDGAIFNATIKNIEEGNSLSADCSSGSCCTLYQNGDQFLCNVKYEVNELSNHSVCVTAFGPDGNQDANLRYYELAADTGGLKGEGFYNGGLSNVDHFITISKRDYNNRLSSQNSKQFNDGSFILDFINGCETKCIIPIAISSDYAGKIRLNNLNLELEDESGPSTFTNFVPIITSGERANFSETFSIKLDYFENLKTPDTINSDNKLFAYIDNLRSNEIQFETVESAPLSIRVLNSYISAGQSINFIARSESNISRFSWNFGDGKNATGKEVNHIFNSSNNYLITLTAMDTNNIMSKVSVNLDVRPISENINNRILSLFSTISLSKESLASSSAQLKDTAEIIGFSDRINKAESDLRVLNITVNNLLINSNISTSEKEKKLIAPNNQLSTIESSTPISLSQDIISFPASITELEDIPMNIGKNEAEKEAIIISQDSVDVSGEARKILVEYPDNSNNDLFILIKKQINSGDGTIYEILPSTLIRKDIIKPEEGYEILNSQIFKLSGVNSIIYSVEGDNIDEAIKSKTIIVPLNLDVNIEEDVSSEPEVVSIDNRISLFWLIVPLFIVICILIYFSMFFHGGLMNKLTKKSARNLFKDIKDHDSVKLFVLKALDKKINHTDIKLALKKKGWKDEQIDSVINEVIKIKRNDK